ncbi:MAG: S8 family serine peptidase [Gemmatimonadaceae bacterium]|nr:S8 family serine peptidase [Gemmatimonadaceae bacterium]
MDPERLNPKLVFKLQLKDGFRELSDEDIGKLGLTVLGSDNDGVLVVFPSDSAVAELRRRVREYAGLEDGAQYSELDAIDSVTELTPQDRIGPQLASMPLATGEIAPLDIELWHSGDRNECRGWIEEISSVLRDLDLAVTDDYLGVSLCILRAKVNQIALERLLDPNIDYIKQIDRRSQPSFELASLRYLDIGEVEQMLADPEGDLTSIVIVDSGVATGHPLLRSVTDDTQTAPGTGTRDSSGDVDALTPGHGTAVAGIAVYSDIGACIANASFIPGARILSARVTDANNQYDPDYLVEHQLEELVTYFLDNYAAAKVINISLGDPNRICTDRDYQFRFAAAVDELAYRFRDREIIFVVSSGNLQFEQEEGERLLAEYPEHLRQPSARIVDPGTSALALTVGSLSYGEGARLYGEHEDRVGRGIAGQRGWP